MHEHNLQANSNVKLVCGSSIEANGTTIVKTDRYRDRNFLSLDLMVLAVQLM